MVPITIIVMETWVLQVKFIPATSILDKEVILGVPKNNSCNNSNNW